MYADTSALVAAYFADEPDHAVLRRMLLEGSAGVVTSEITRVEMASALWRAGLRRPSRLLQRFEADCSEAGPILLLALRPESVMPEACRLVREHPLRTLDALHLAVAMVQCPVLSDDHEVQIVTRDAGQAAAARRLGLGVL